MKTERTESSGLLRPVDSTPGLRPGATLSGVVLAALSANLYSIDFGRFRTTAFSNLRLRRGERIRVRVSRRNTSQPLLKLLGRRNPETPGETLSQLLDELGLDSGWLDALARLLDAVPEEENPGRSLAAAVALLGGLPARERMRGAELLAAVRRRTGLWPGPGDCGQALGLLRSNAPGAWVAGLPRLIRHVEELRAKKPAQAPLARLEKILSLFPALDAENPRGVLEWLNADPDPEQVLGAALRACDETAGPIAQAAESIEADSLHQMLALEAGTPLRILPWRTGKQTWVPVQVFAGMGGQMWIEPDLGADRACFLRIMERAPGGAVDIEASASLPAGLERNLREEFGRIGGTGCRVTLLPDDTAPAGPRRAEVDLTA